MLLNGSSPLIHVLNLSAAVGDHPHALCANVLLLQLDLVDLSRMVLQLVVAREGCLLLTIKTEVAFAPGDRAPEHVIRGLGVFSVVVAVGIRTSLEQSLAVGSRTGIFEVRVRGRQGRIKSVRLNKVRAMTWYQQVKELRRCGSTLTCIRGDIRFDVPVAFAVSASGRKKTHPASAGRPWPIMGAGDSLNAGSDWPAVVSAEPSKGGRGKGACTGPSRIKPCWAELADAESKGGQWWSSARLP